MTDPPADGGSMAAPPDDTPDAGAERHPDTSSDRAPRPAPDSPAPDRPAPDTTPAAGAPADGAADRGVAAPPRTGADGLPWWQPEPGERLLWAGAPATRGSVEEPADAVALVAAVLLLLGSGAACVRFEPLRFVGHLSPLLIGGAAVFLVALTRVWRHRRWLRRLRYAVTDRRVIVGAGRFRRAWRHEALPHPFAVARRHGQTDIVYGDRTPAVAERTLRSYLDAGTTELPLNPWPVLLGLDDETADRLIAAYG